MRFIQLLTDVLKIKATFIVFYSINTVLLLLYFYLLHSYHEFLYPLGLSLFLLAIYIGISCMVHWHFSKKIAEAKESPYIETDDLTLEERMVFGTINEIHQKYHQQLYQKDNMFKEHKALFYQWIHNMKGSIAIIDLAAKKGTADAVNDIREENEKLKQNLEECLNVLRLDDFSRDYLPEKTNLAALVTEAVNCKKKDFIYAHVYPKVAIDEQHHVFTDHKWCRYMIEQILSNSIKYSHGQQYITISTDSREDGILLTIEDTGIGIDTEDLARVFDPFFTGKNGRQHHSATGIGLYMVKQIGNKLNHTITVESEKGRGTKVALFFKDTIAGLDT
ncbi:ATP-binding protein [Bacillus sp. 1P06AnD]|uniref:ATP-binding protein n=1 Tax=Bacillus sp. 1P06AnD TaxID=3132208 RepID=UPI00399FA81B